ncbi:hypothetical protein ACP275_02G067900 [Erythranthe tilingii]
MAFTSVTVFLAWLLLIAISGINLSNSTKFTITNFCNETIWPAITPNNFSGGGFALRPTQSAVFTAPPAWHGRIWARTGCNFDKNGTGSCQTGACGTHLQCAGAGVPPATVVLEFSLGGEIDYYEVSLVDGFNLPVVVEPVGGKGNCSSVGCERDLLPDCPAELTLKSPTDGVVACRSACDVYERDDYCCRGAFSTPVACLPTNYSRIFKEACPRAYSFAYDDPTSIVTCSAADYMVTFCSSRNQTQCTYHDKKLICNEGSGMLKELSQVWKLLLLAISTPLFM